MLLCRSILSYDTFCWKLVLVNCGMAMGATTQSFDKHVLLRTHPFFKDLGDAVIDRLAPRVITTKVAKGRRYISKKGMSARSFTPFAQAR